ncbi:MAG: hypothetical protein ACFFC3_03490 [Candidatus Odinarchaeota archaeon]
MPFYRNRRSYKKNQIYKCSLCKKEVQFSSILKCDICHSRLCEDCNIGGFCTNHFKELSPEGQNIFIQIKEKNKKKNRILSLIIVIYTVIFIICVFIPVIYDIINIIINHSIETLTAGVRFIERVMVIAIILLFGFFLLIIITFAISYISNKQYLAKKLEIYSKYKQSIS